MSTFTLPKPERKPLAGNPVGVTINDFLDAGLRNTAYSAWHDESKSEDGRWCWHASALCRCPRKQILKRAGYVMDIQDRDQAMLLEQAKFIHEVMYRFSLAYTADPENEAQVAIAEIGYRHPALNLAAKPDLLLNKRGNLVLIDYKTEKEGAAGWRHKRAEAAGSTSAASHDHQVQLVATAMCLEACGAVPEELTEGRIWYFSRQEWWTDEQPVLLGDPALRAEVHARVLALDEAWAAFEQWHSLPHRLDQTDKSVAWECRLRNDKAGDRLGKFCEARSVCFHPKMPA